MSKVNQAWANRQKAVEADILNLLNKEVVAPTRIKKLALIENCKVCWRTAVKDGVDIESLLYLTDIIDRRYRDAIKST